MKLTLLTLFIVTCITSCSENVWSSYTWYLPVENQINTTGSLKVLLKTKSNRCKDLKVKVNNNEFSLSKTSYPGELFTEVALVEKISTVQLISSNKKCHSSIRTVISKPRTQVNFSDELSKSMGVFKPESSEKRSPFWEDAMLFLGLLKYQKFSSEKNKIQAYLEHFFKYIESKGMKKINHPDRAPMVMASVLFNSLNNTNYVVPVNNFSQYLDRLRINKLGLVDHMGQSWWKRIGSRIIFNFLGHPKSVWADSMMMYVMTSIIVGAHNAETSQRDSYEFGVDQLMKMIDVLQTESGLFKHSFDYTKNSFRPKEKNTFWLRANGWAVATLAMSLEYLTKESKEYKKVKVALQKSLTKLFELQDEKLGLWRTILISDKDYKSINCHFNNDYETSGSTLVVLAMALAIKEGVLSQVYKSEVERVYRSLKLFISKRKESEKYQLNWMSDLTNTHRRACGYEKFYHSNDNNHSYGIGPFLYLSAVLKELE